MSLNDSIADMLTRIRNASLAKHANVVIPHSRLKESIVSVLSNEGFIRSYEVSGDSFRKALVVTLKYTEDREPIFSELARVSKPGRRLYIPHQKLKPIKQGAGMYVLSTPKGVMKDEDARKLGLGGEILCQVS
ncbi:MAG: 30S ribosomal protein S8 [Deltaproteobacteria bacterium]|nr:30S ribosomal protein S8 [Deltaproteobacteria bacterium]